VEKLIVTVRDLVVNWDGIVLNLPSILIIGNALRPHLKRNENNGSSAARPAPIQCIFPVAASPNAMAKTTQSADRKANARRSEIGSPLSFLHQYQTDSTKMARRITRNIIDSISFS
jgi:hypothetical protein